MTSDFIKHVAQAGLAAKGSVYVLLGLLAFMAAFELGGKGNNDATQTGALQFLKELPAGFALLLAIAIGILCYSVWRGIQTFRSDGGHTKWTKRLRYFLSGLTYLAFAVTAFRLVIGQQAGNSNRNQSIAGELLEKPFGQLLVGLGGLILAAVGAWQIYYGLSEKYRKHVQNLSLQSSHSSLLLRSGKVGYISRGVVWLVIAFLFLRAAYYAAGSQAGDTADAFRFVESSPFGSPLLGLLGLGLIAYGVFNFIRARYERLG
jgi:hypothetical protein